MKKLAKKVKTEVQTDYGVFVAVLEHEPDMGGYMVTVPRVPPAITWGKTMAHAKEMAREAIELTLETDIYGGRKGGQNQIYKKSARSE